MHDLILWGTRFIGTSIRNNIVDVHLAVQLPDLIKKEDFIKLEGFFHWLLAIESDPLATPFVYIDNIFDQDPACYFK